MQIYNVDGTHSQFIFPKRQQTATYFIIRMCSIDLLCVTQLNWNKNEKKIERNGTTGTPPARLSSRSTHLNLKQRHWIVQHLNTNGQFFATAIDWRWWTIDTGRCAQWMGHSAAHRCAGGILICCTHFITCHSWWLLWLWWWREQWCWPRGVSGCWAAKFILEEADRLIKNLEIKNGCGRECWFSDDALMGFG